MGVDAKRCPSCGATKPATEFGRNQSLGDGLSFYCLACNRAKSNAHYRKRRQALGKSVRDHSWIPEGFRWCPSCESAVAQDDFGRSSYTASGLASNCKACKNAASSSAYFYRKYKLTQRELAALREAQADRCAICGEQSPQHLDHDHATGGIRRLLCQRCNHGLGLFRDDPRLLHAAGFYVEFHTARQEIAAELAAMSRPSDAATRPGEPPVGSERRPGTHTTSARSTGRTSGARRRQQAGEADV
jgi:Recombination endonuclease VII